MLERFMIMVWEFLPYIPKFSLILLEVSSSRKHAPLFIRNFAGQICSMKGFVTLLISLFLVHELEAQHIQGQIKDADGGPVTGATVAIQNTFLSTISDQAGTFRLKTEKPGEYRLLVSAVGYA